MATKKISEFTTLGSLSDSDILPVVNAGSNKKITGATLKTYAQSGLTIPTDVSDLTDTTSLLGGGTGAQGPAGNDGAAGAQGPAGNDGAAGAQGPAGNDGAAGAQGPAGNDGAPGQGVPTGGTVGQVLAKIDSTDYNTEWVNQTGGSGSGFDTIAVAGSSDVIADGTTEFELVAGTGIAITTGSNNQITISAASSSGLSAPYKGFRAHYGTMYNNTDDENGPINKLVIYKSSVTPASAIDTDTSSDDFQVTGLTGSDVVAMLVVVTDGTDWNIQTPSATLKTFVETIIDEVILDGGVEGDVNTVSAMKSAFYANFSNFSTVIPNPKTDLEFFSVNTQFSISPALATGDGATFSGISYNMSNDTLDLGNWGQGTPNTHEVNDVHVIPGNTIQDADGNFLLTPANDVTVTITGVGGGFISTVTVTGTLPRPAEIWPSTSISDGGDDEYDGGNAIHTNLDTEISYNSGNVVSSSSAFNGGDYVVTYQAGIFGVFATGCDISTIGTSGDSGGYGNDSSSSGFDGDGVAVTGSLYGESNEVSLGDFVFTDSTLTARGNGGDMFIKAGDDLWLDALDDDIHIRASNEVRIKTGYNFQNDSAQQEWQFGADGALTLPEGSYIDETAAPLGTAKSLDLHPGDPIYPTQYLRIYPTVNGDADHLHLTSGDLTATELFLGDDEQYVKLTNNGNVEIRTGAFDSYNDTKGVWTFDSDGALTLPTHNATPGSRIKSAVDITIETGPYYLVDLQSTGGGSGGGIGVLDFQISSAPDWATAVAVGDHVVSGAWTDIIIAVSDISAPGNGRWRVEFASEDFTGATNTYSFYKPGAAGGAWTFGTDGVLTLPEGGTIDNTSTIVTVTVDQLTSITAWTGTLVFTRVSDILYQVLPSGPTMELVVDTWRLRFQTGTWYESTDLINWGNVAGSSPAPVGTLGILETMNLTVDSNEWILDNNGTLTLPSGGTISDSGLILNEGLAVISNPTIQLTPATPDVASQKLVVKGGGVVDYHLHLTTGDLAETSIFLGTDDHNVRTTINGNIEITTPNTVNNVWKFYTDGSLKFPRDEVTNTDPILTIVGGATPSITSTDAGLAGPANLAMSVDYLNISGSNGNKIVAYPDQGVLATDANMALVTNLAAGANNSAWIFGTDGALTLAKDIIVGNNGGHIYQDAGQAGNPSSIKWVNMTGQNNMLRVFADDRTTLADERLNVSMDNDHGLYITTYSTTDSTWLFGTDGDLTAPGNIILNNPVTTVTTSVTGTVADSNGNPFTFRILKADNPQLVTPFADPNFVLKWTGSDAGSAAAAAQAPGGQGPSSLVGDDGTYWNFNSWFGLNSSRPNTGTVFTVEYGVVVSDTMISTTETNLVIEADAKQYKFGTDGNLTLPAGGDIVDSDNNSVIKIEAPFVIKTTGFDAFAGGRYGVNTTSNTVTATLPPSPAAGDAIWFADAGGAYATNNLIINPGSNTIMSASGTMTVSTNDQSFGVFYNGTTWRVY